MSRLRWLILIVGPVPIVAASWALTKWIQSGDAALPLAANDVVVRGQGPANDARPAAAAARPAAAAPQAEGDLEPVCRAAAEELSSQLDEDCATIVRPPFVIAGDLSRSDLERWHRRTIGPAARAMAASYFRVPPSAPITVFLFSGEESYSRYARESFGDQNVSVYGYYKPARRTLVMNIGTGGGTLVHELTHALIDFDFPAVPDWFNEGLASLHEQCRFREDGSGIDGLVNWRLPALKQAIERGRLRSLESLIGDNDFRGRHEGLNYAQARYFCMYMQERGVLEDYFRRFRANQQQDPLGLATVAEVFPEQSWAELDLAFQEWTAALKMDDER